MSNHEETKAAEATDGVANRRGFLTTALAALATVASGRSVKATAERARPIGPQASRQRAFGVDPASSHKLLPRYLPPGYQFASRHTGVPSGFASGPGEVGIFYKNYSISNGNYFPLAIYVAEADAGPFGLTEERKGVPIEMPIPVQDAVYFDGSWRVANDEAAERVTSRGVRQVWDTSVRHAVVARLRDMSIGIRASKKHGVSREELIRVLHSMVAPIA